MGDTNNNKHPITPPPELFKQWEGMPRSLAFEAAYRAGAARRPKPPSLKEQALEALAQVHHAIEQPIAITIRRALEQLDD